jgi:hypothetical protein
MRWERHVAHMGRREVYTGYWRGNLSERENLEDPGVNGSKILILIFRQWDVGAWNGSMWLRRGTDGGHL